MSPVVEIQYNVRTGKQPDQGVAKNEACALSHCYQPRMSPLLDIIPSTTVEMRCIIAYVGCQMRSQLIKKGLNSVDTTFDGYAGRAKNGDELASGVRIH